MAKEKMFDSRDVIAGCRCSWFVSLLLLTLRGASAVVRCYCNDALCINTGYMCKSDLGLCYTTYSVTSHQASSSAVSSRSSAPRRGCVDFLSASDPSVTWSCQPEMTSSSLRERREGPAARDQLQLECCRYDLCNYADVDNAAILPPPPRSASASANDYDDDSDDDDDSIDEDDGGGWFIPHHLTSSPPVNHAVLSSSSPSSSSSTSNSEAWLRAAVIAVPLAGLLLLTVLVLIAVRMLRHDFRSRSHITTARTGTGCRRLDCRCGDVIAGNSTAVRLDGCYEKMIASSDYSITSGRGFLLRYDDVTDHHHVIDGGATRSPGERATNYAVDDVMCSRNTCTYMNDDNVGV